jgi:hypothetical protein
VVAVVADVTVVDGEKDGGVTVSVTAGLQARKKTSATTDHLILA